MGDYSVHGCNPKLPFVSATAAIAMTAPVQNLMNKLIDINQLYQL